MNDILDAAYASFARHGVRRTTMADIADEAGLSRAAVYQYVRNKEDAYRRVAARMFDRALALARGHAAGTAPLGVRLAAALTTKLDLTLQIWHDSPHASELLGAGARLTGDLEAGYTAAMHAVLTAAIHEAHPDADADELADLLLAFTRGLEADPADPTDPRGQHHLLARGVALLVADHGGVAAPTAPKEES